MSVGEKYIKTLVWWVIPKILAGMRSPYLHVNRGLKKKNGLLDFDDDLGILWNLHIRSVVCLLNRPKDNRIYEEAGFHYLCLPVVDGQPPTVLQSEMFIDFVNENSQKYGPVVTHCEGGIGRTGTMMAVYLISKGFTDQEAILRIRSIQPGAIETSTQVEFLKNFSQKFRKNSPI